MEDILSAHSDPTVRKVALEVKEKISLQAMSCAPITLEYLDPFAADADPSTYTEAGNATPAKGKGPRCC